MRLSYSEMNMGRASMGGFFYSSATDPQLQTEALAPYYPPHIYSGEDYVREFVVSHTYKIGDLRNPNRNFVSVEVEEISEEVTDQGNMDNSTGSSPYTISEVKALLHTVDAEGRAAKMLLYMTYAIYEFSSDFGQGSYSYGADFGPTFSLVYQYPETINDEDAIAFAKDVLASYTVYPIWQQTCNHFTLQAQKQKQTVPQAITSSLQETQEYINNSRQEVIQGMANSNSENLDMWTDILTERQDVVNPLNNNELTVSNQYNHVWVTEDNQVLYSDDATFNPNDFEGFGGSTWQEAGSGN